MKLWSVRERAFLLCVLWFVPWLALGAAVNVAVAWACSVFGGYLWGAGLTYGQRCIFTPTSIAMVSFLDSSGLPFRTFSHSHGVAILWPGFAINTIFYAAMLWLLFAAPGYVRRRVRVRRGLCPACAYPIGTSDVCTECGKPLRSCPVTIK